MQSEDYFGFQNENKAKIHKVGKRTQLSAERLTSRSKEKKTTDQGLERLKKKYDQINKEQAHKKKKRKQGKATSSLDRLPYFGMQFKYFRHYEGSYDRNYQMRQRLEKKALEAVERNKVQSKQKKPCSLTNNKIEIQSIMKEIINQRQKFTARQYADGKSQIREHSKSNSSLKSQKYEPIGQSNKLMKPQCSKMPSGLANRFNDYALNIKSQKKPEHESNKVTNETLNNQNESYGTSYINYVQLNEEKQQLTPNISINSKSESDNIEESSLKRKSETGQSFQKQTSLYINDYQRIKDMEKKAKRQTVKIITEEVELKYSISHYQFPQVQESYLMYKNSKINDQMKVTEIKGAQLRQAILENPNNYKGYNQTIPENPNSYKGYNQTIPENPNSYKGYNQSKIANNQSNLSISESGSNNINSSKSKHLYSPKLVMEQDLDQYQPENEHFRQQEWMNSNPTYVNNEINEESSLMEDKNLIESIRIWSSYEEQKLYQRHDKVSQSSEVELILNKLYKHLEAVNWLAQYVEETEQFYEQEQKVEFELASFLLYRKFYEERVNIVNSLREGRSCFHLTGKDISDSQIKKHYKSEVIMNFANAVESCNGLIWKSLNMFYWDIRIRFPDNPVVNLQKLKRNEIRILMNLLNEEVELLIPKIDDLQMEKSFDKENDYEAISWRSFRIIENVLLLSELERRKTKQLLTTIDAEDFEYYCKQYYGIFQETILFYN